MGEDDTRDGEQLMILSDNDIRLAERYVTNELVKDAASVLSRHEIVNTNANGVWFCSCGLGLTDYNKHVAEIIATRIVASVIKNCKSKNGGDAAC